MATLGSNRYGKQKVRVLRKIVEGDRQSVVEISADVLLEGAFERSFLSEDNTQIVATDTCKNTVIALAHQHLGPCIEDFALTLGRHFLERHPHVERVNIELREKRWERMTINGKPAPHSFHSSPLGTPFTRLTISRDAFELESGVRDLLVLNSTNSAFVNFDHTEFTTLKDATDRILSTVMEATWKFTSDRADFFSANSRILSTLLEIFATNFSPSVQRTLFEMGEASLAVVPEISQITMSLPNKHYFTANLSAFGMENPNLTFLPQDEPHGQIEATVTR
jgi:urate oxidase